MSTSWSPGTTISRRWLPHCRPCSRRRRFCAGSARRGSRGPSRRSGQARPGDVGGLGGEPGRLPTVVAAASLPGSRPQRALCPPVPAPHPHPHPHPHPSSHRNPFPPHNPNMNHDVGVRCGTDETPQCLGRGGTESPPREARPGPLGGPSSAGTSCLVRLDSRLDTSRRVLRDAGRQVDDVGRPLLGRYAARPCHGSASSTASSSACGSASISRLTSTPRTGRASFHRHRPADRAQEHAVAPAARPGHGVGCDAPAGAGRVLAAGTERRTADIGRSAALGSWS
jgi:hypothetical protein